VTRTTRSASASVVGGFAEHLGRCVYGDDFVSGYRWRDAVGPIEERAARMELAWHDLVPNTFGTNEYVDRPRRRHDRRPVHR
jgi:alpha-L-arabinofuranosidase